MDLHSDLLQDDSDLTFTGGDTLPVDNTDLTFESAIANSADVTITIEYDSDDESQIPTDHNGEDDDSQKPID